MRYTHTFRLTQDHIDRGEPNKPNSCPVALALKEHGYRAAVNVAMTFIADRGYRNTTTLQDWIMNFDRCETQAGKPVRLIVHHDTSEIRLDGRSRFIDTKDGY